MEQDNICPVEMFQSPVEFNPLLDLYRELKPKNVLEIGALFGGTLWHWLKYIQPGGKVTVVDMLVSTFDSRYGQQFECHDKLWYLWAKAAQTDLKIYEQSSIDPRVVNSIHSRYHGDPLDFVFIDGDHTYQGVKQDFEAYIDLVRAGGIVAFHDISIPDDHPHYGGVNRLWRELKQTYRCEEFVETPGWWGIGVLHV